MDAGVVAFEDVVAKVDVVVTMRDLRHQLLVSSSFSIYYSISLTFSRLELGEYQHECEEDMVVKSTNEMVPYFNAYVYLENITKIGKIDEIFGPTNLVVHPHPVSGYTNLGFKAPLE